MEIDLRAYVFLDSLQPQLAAFTGCTGRGFPPIRDDASLWIVQQHRDAVRRQNHQRNPGNIGDERIRFGKTLPCVSGSDNLNTRPVHLTGKCQRIRRRADEFRQAFVVAANDICVVTR